MSLLLIILQLWLLCCCTVVAAHLLGLNSYRVARCTPALAAAFLVLRAFV